MTNSTGVDLWGVTVLMRLTSDDASNILLGLQVTTVLVLASFLSAINFYSGVQRRTRMQASVVLVFGVTGLILDMVYRYYRPSALFSWLALTCTDFAALLALLLEMEVLKAFVPLASSRWMTLSSISRLQVGAGVWYVAWALVPQVYTLFTDLGQPSASPQRMIARTGTYVWAITCSVYDISQCVMLFFILLRNIRLLERYKQQFTDELVDLSLSATSNGGKFLSGSTLGSAGRQADSIVGGGKRQAMRLKIKLQRDQQILMHHLTWINVFNALLLVCGVVVMMLGTILQRRNSQTLASSYCGQAAYILAGLHLAVICCYFQKLQKLCLSVSATGHQ